MFLNFEELENEINKCRKCKLCTIRKKVVLGYGNKNCNIMFIGQCPEKEDDLNGNILNGQGGKLLEKAFEGLGINKEEIYITNLLKCRTYKGNIPQNEEVQACLNYLRNEVILIKPKIIVLFGSVVLKSILGENCDIISCRGKFIERKGIMYMPTWSLDILLKDNEKKLEFWKDLKLVIKKNNQISM